MLLFMDQILVTRALGHRVLLFELKIMSPYQVGRFNANSTHSQTEGGPRQACQLSLVYLLMTSKAMIIVF